MQLQQRKNIYCF